VSVAAPLSTSLERQHDPIDFGQVDDLSIDLTVDKPIVAAPHQPTPFVKEPVFPFVVLGTITFLAIVIFAYFLAIGV
jgi:hypothetical protein